MITSDNIYRAIKTRLKEFFKPKDLQIKDIKNIEAPCLYVQYVNSSDNEVANDTISTKCLFNVVYFASVEALTNLLEVETRLKKAFKKALPVEYVNANGEKVRKFIKPEVDSDPDENDYIFSMSLNFEFLQDAEIEIDEFNTGEFDNPELMEELRINKGKEN